MSRAEGSASAVFHRQMPNRSKGTLPSNHDQPQVPLLLINRYRVSNMIGSGSFGYIFEADDIETNGQVAIKFESQTLRYPQLAYEARILKLIHGIGIPKIMWSVHEIESRIFFSL